jgi:GNAT superfamily N-acetyltransferase
MTTTLRPTEPLRRYDDGTRSCRYQVCANGRPVGRLRLGSYRELGDTVAVISELYIDEPERERGRGTVAALVAEEVARDWGCTRMTGHVPADAEPARRLAAALGYVGHDGDLGKPLT